MIKLSVVVQHLFKMRHQPDRIDRVAVKPAAELIVDSAARHFVERVRDHFAAPVRRLSGGDIEAEIPATSPAEISAPRQIRR